MPKGGRESNEKTARKPVVTVRRLTGIRAVKPITEDDIPQLWNQWFQEYKDILSGIIPKLPPLREVNLSRSHDPAEPCTPVEAPPQSSSSFVIPLLHYTLLHSMEHPTLLFIVTMSLSSTTISFCPSMLPLAFVLIIVSLLVMTSLICDLTLFLFRSVDP